MNIEEKAQTKALTRLADAAERIATEMERTEVTGVPAEDLRLPEMILDLQTGEHRPRDTSRDREPNGPLIHRAFLVCGRKQGWNVDIPPGWDEVGFERFDFVECGIFHKSAPAMTAEDFSFWEDHINPPDEFSWPSGYDGWDNTNFAVLQTEEIINTIVDNARDSASTARARRIEQLTDGFSMEKLRLYLFVAEHVDMALDEYHKALLKREDGDIAADKLTQAVEFALGRGDFEAQRGRLLGDDNEA